MFKIINKKRLAERVTEYTVYAPDVALNADAGQFVILRVGEEGERVPFTVCDFDRKKGTVTILAQTVGYTTAKMEKAEYFTDFVGPLGRATDLSKYKNIALVGGGIGAAVIFPQAKKLRAAGAPADVILGARDGSLIMYEKEFKKLTRNFYVATDDGSRGVKGFVTDVLRERINAGAGYDCVFAVGPLPMMRAAVTLAGEYGVKSVVSMNSLMVDGTGMCGCCRLTVGGKVKYACVDGPEFDGNAVDFDEAINRSKTYAAIEKEHMCRLKT